MGPFAAALTSRGPRRCARRAVGRLASREDFSVSGRDDRLLATDVAAEATTRDAITIAIDDGP